MLATHRFVAIGGLAAVVALDMAFAGGYQSGSSMRQLKGVK
jgi:hypothetical protein